MSDFTVRSRGHQTQPPRLERAYSNRLVALAIASIVAYGSYHHLPRNIRGVVSASIFGLGAAYACNMTWGCFFKTLSKIFAGGGGRQWQSHSSYNRQPQEKPPGGGGQWQSHSPYNRQPQKKTPGGGGQWQNNSSYNGQPQKKTPGGGGQWQNNSSYNGQPQKKTPGGGGQWQSHSPYNRQPQKKTPGGGGQWQNNSPYNGQPQKKTPGGGGSRGGSRPPLPPASGNPRKKHH